MANLNKVFLIGRLTRDPEIRIFQNGGKVAKFGFAVNNRKKNPQSGQWEDEPVWLDCEAYNRGESGTLADRVENHARKGTQIYIEAHLHLDQWTDQQGAKQSKLKMVVDQIQLLDAAQGGPPPQQGGYQQHPPQQQRGGYQQGPQGGYQGGPPPQQQQPQQRQRTQYGTPPDAPGGYQGGYQAPPHQGGYQGGQQQPLFAPESDLPF